MAKRSKRKLDDLYAEEAALHNDLLKLRDDLVFSPSRPPAHGKTTSDQLLKHNEWETKSARKIALSGKLIPEEQDNLAALRKQADVELFSIEKELKQAEDRRSCVDGELLALKINLLDLLDTVRKVSADTADTEEGRVQLMQLRDRIKRTSICILDLDYSVISVLEEYKQRTERIIRNDLQYQVFFHNFAYKYNII